MSSARRAGGEVNERQEADDAPANAGCGWLRLLGAGQHDLRERDRLGVRHTQQRRRSAEVLETPKSAAAQNEAWRAAAAHDLDIPPRNAL